MVRQVIAVVVAVAIFMFFKSNFQAAEQNQKEIREPEKSTSNPIAPAVEVAVKSIQGFVLKDVNLNNLAPKATQPKPQSIKRVVRSVRDCIKPGDLIDDEVQMCVNGTLEKYW